MNNNKKKSFTLIQKTRKSSEQLELISFAHNSLLSCQVGRSSSSSVYSCSAWVVHWWWGMGRSVSLGILIEHASSATRTLWHLTTLSGWQTIKKIVVFVPSNKWLTMATTSCPSPPFSLMKSKSCSTCVKRISQCGVVWSTCHESQMPAFGAIISQNQHEAINK